MNSYAFSENSHNSDAGMTDHQARDAGAPYDDARSYEPSLVIQILSTIAFGVVSIVAVAMAFSAFWLAGLVTTAVIAGTWSSTAMFGNRRRWHRKAHRQAVRNVAPSVHNDRSSGNASFDAYRAEMLDSLEQESRDFEGFLTRLREARGKMEFDKYMEERTEASKNARARVIALNDDLDYEPVVS